MHKNILKWEAEEITEEKDQEIEKLVNELEEQERHIKEANYEIERLNNIINESAKEILKELEENHHLSYGVALAIRQKLLDYKEVKGDSSNE